jgi:hypothetical protein
MNKPESTTYKTNGECACAVPRAHRQRATVEGVRRSRTYVYTPPPHRVERGKVLWKGLGGAPAPSPRCGVVRQGFGQYGIKVSFWGAAPGAGHPDDPGTDPDLITLTLTLTTVPNPNPNTLTPVRGILTKKSLKPSLLEQIFDLKEAVR